VGGCLRCTTRLPSLPLGRRVPSPSATPTPASTGAKMLATAAAARSRARSQIRAVTSALTASGGGRSSGAAGSPRSCSSSSSRAAWARNASSYAARTSACRPRMLARSRCCLPCSAGGCCTRLSGRGASATSTLSWSASSCRDSRLRVVTPDIGDSAQGAGVLPGGCDSGSSARACGDRASGGSGGVAERPQPRSRDDEASGKGELKGRPGDKRTRGLRGPWEGVVAALLLLPLNDAESWRRRLAAVLTSGTESDGISSSMFCGCILSYPREASLLLRGTAWMAPEVTTLTRRSEPCRARAPAGTTLAGPGHKIGW